MKRLLPLLALLFAPLAFAVNPALGYHTISAAFINAASYTFTAGTTQATGSSFLIIVGTRSGAAQPTFTGDTYGNTYALLTPTTGTNPEINTSDSEPNIWVFVCATGCSGGASHTVTVHTTAANIGFAEFIEITNSGGVDLSVMAKDLTGTLQYFSNPLTTTTANDFVVGDAMSGGGTGIAAIGPAGTGFVALENVSSTYFMASDYLANASVGSHDPDIGTSNHSSYKFVGLTIAFKPAAGGGSCTSTAWVNGGTKAIPTASSTSVWLSTGAWGTTPCDGTGTSWWSTSGNFVKQ